MAIPPPSEQPANVRQKHIKQLLKTEMCKFFLINKCGKGSLCSFAHDPSEIRKKPDLNRTSMCKVFLASGNCQVPNCAFAHDERELRTTDGFFKTKLCRFASSGRCKHGVSCRFAHDPEEISDVIPIQPGQRQQQSRSNSNLLNEMLDHQMAQVTEGAGMRPRQPQFQMDMAPEASGQEQNFSAGESFDQRTNRDGGSDQSTRADTSASVPTP